MITVTRLNGRELTINCDLIESMEETPDTVITFTNGTKLIVTEKISTIKERIILYKREIFRFQSDGNESDDIK